MAPPVFCQELKLLWKYPSVQSSSIFPLLCRFCLAYLWILSCIFSLPDIKSLCARNVMPILRVSYESAVWHFSWITCHEISAVLSSFIVPLSWILGVPWNALLCHVPDNLWCAVYEEQKTMPNQAHGINCAIYSNTVSGTMFFLLQRRYFSSIILYSGRLEGCTACYCVEYRGLPFSYSGRL